MKILPEKKGEQSPWSQSLILSSTKRWRSLERRESCAKIEKNLSWIKNFLRRRVRALEVLAQRIIHRRFFGVLSKHTLPKSLNFPFLRASRYTLCLSDYFFVRTRIEFINYAKYKFLCTRSRTKNLSQQLFSRSHNLPSPASEESRGNYFCACYNTVIIT